MLNGLPLDILKIDRTLVAELSSGRPMTALAAIAVTVGRALGLRTVADGITTTTEVAALVAAGCEYGQGPLFAAPGDASSIMAFAQGRGVLVAVEA